MIQCLQRSFAMLNTITITKHTWRSRHQMLHKHGNTTTMTEWPNSTVSNVKHDTMQCHYNTVNILQNIDNRHPIAHRMFQRAGYVLCNVSSKSLTNALQITQCTAVINTVLCWTILQRLMLLDSKVHGVNMGPIWGRQDPGGPPCWPHELCYLGSCF